MGQWIALSAAEISFGVYIGPFANLNKNPIVMAEIYTRDAHRLDCAIP